MDGIVICELTLSLPLYQEAIKNSQDVVIFNYIPGESW